VVLLAGNVVLVVVVRVCVFNSHFSHLNYPTRRPLPSGSRLPWGGPVPISSVGAGARGAGGSWLLVKPIPKEGMGGGAFFGAHATSCAPIAGGLVWKKGGTCGLGPSRCDSGGGGVGGGAWIIQASFASCVTHW